MKAPFPKTPPKAAVAQPPTKQPRSPRGPSRFRDRSHPITRITNPSSPLKNSPSVGPVESYINKQCLTRTHTKSYNLLIPPPGGGGNEHWGHHQIRILWMKITCPTTPPPTPSHCAHVTSIVFSAAATKSQDHTRKETNPSLLIANCVIYRRGQPNEQTNPLPSDRQKNLSSGTRAFFFFNDGKKKVTYGKSPAAEPPAGGRGR